MAGPSSKKEAVPGLVSSATMPAFETLGIALFREPVASIRVTLEAAALVGAVARERDATASFWSAFLHFMFAFVNDQLFWTPNPGVSERRERGCQEREEKGETIFDTRVASLLGVQPTYFY